MLQETPSLRIIVAFPTNSPLHQFPLTKNDRKQLLCVSRVRFLLRQPGNSHLGRNITHWRVLREANVESGLSLQTRRELLQQVISQYREATTGYNRKYAMWLLNHAKVRQSTLQHTRRSRDATGSPTCLQPYLHQTPHSLSHHAGRSVGAA